MVFLGVENKMKLEEKTKGRKTSERKVFMNFPFEERDALPLSRSRSDPNK